MHDTHWFDPIHSGNECSGLGDGTAVPSREEVGIRQEVKLPGLPERHCLANAKHKVARTLDALLFNISVAVERGTCTEARVVG